MSEIDHTEAKRRFDERVPQLGPDDCWPCSGKPNCNGYGRIRANGYEILAHRLSFFVFHGRWPKPMCLHMCKSNRRCCNPAHLYEGTHADNMTDAQRDGMMAMGERNGAHTHPERWARGEKHVNAKLTWERVEWVRARYAAGGVAQEWLASVLGVSRRLIGKVVREEIWKKNAPPETAPKNAS